MHQHEAAHIIEHNVYMVLRVMLVGFVLFPNALHLLSVWWCAIYVIVYCLYICCNGSDCSRPSNKTHC